MTSRDKNGPAPDQDGASPLTGELSIQVTVPGQEKKARNSPRVPVNLDAGLRPRGGYSVISVQILDLSTHGFRIESSLDLSIGMDVWLRLPSLEPCHAKVAWVEGYTAGCAFERPLHPAVLDMILSRAGT